MRETYQIHENKGKKTYLSFFQTAHGGKLRLIFREGRESEPYPSRGSPLKMTVSKKKE